MTDARQEFDWSIVDAWHGHVSTKGMMEKKYATSVGILAMRDIFTTVTLGIEDKTLQVFVSKDGDLRVRALKDINEGGLVLAPAAPSKPKLTETCEHPHGVLVKIQDTKPAMEKSFELWIWPEWKPPTTTTPGSHGGTTARSMNAVQVDDDVSLNVFWKVRRVARRANQPADEDDNNMHFVEHSLNIIRILKAGSTAHNMTTTVTVPLLVNKTALKMGDELTVCETRAKADKKKVEKAKRTWESDARKPKTAKTAKDVPSTEYC